MLGDLNKLKTDYAPGVTDPTVKGALAKQHQAYRDAVQRGDKLQDQLTLELAQFVGIDFTETQQGAEGMRGSGIAELARAADLNRGALQKLAAAGALGTLSAHRHEASWLALGAERPLGSLQLEAATEPPVSLPAPSEAQASTRSPSMAPPSRRTTSSSRSRVSASPRR